MTEISGAYLASFIRATALLALPAESQGSWLSSLGLPGASAYVDELATEFDDGVHLLNGFVEAGWLNSEAVERLKKVDSLLADLSKPERAGSWTVEAPAASAEWDAVRSAARRALYAI